MDHQIEIEQLLRGCVVGHLANHFQKKTSDHSVLQGIMHVITEKQVYEVVSQRTQQKMVYTIGTPYVVKAYIEEDNGTIKALMPQTCRYRSKPYTCHIYVPWIETAHVFNQSTKTWSDAIRITRHTASFELPVCIGSTLCHGSDGHSKFLETECPYDKGGYFIVKGTEKVIVCPINLQTNTPYIHCDDYKSGAWTLQYRALPDHKKRSTSTLILHLNVRKGDATPTIKVTVPFVANPIPLSMVLRLLGVKSSLSVMMESILGDDDSSSSSSSSIDPRLTQLLRLCLRDQFVDMPMDDIVQHLVRNSSSYDVAAAAATAAAGETASSARGRTVYNNFTSEFLPNMGMPGDHDYLIRKERMFGYLVWLLLNAYIQCPTEESVAAVAMDRDDCKYKRIEHTGGEITYLFRRAWRLYIKTVLGASHNSMEQSKNLQLQDLTKVATLQSTLMYAFATGNWGTEKAGSVHTGISQQRSTLNYGAMLSHIDRVASQFNREGKDPKPRQLHTSQWGVMCPVETPDGDACGQIHNLTAQTHVRIGVPGHFIRPIVLQPLFVISMTQCTRKELRTGTRVFLNGSLDGILVAPPHEYMDNLRQARSAGALPFDTTIAMSADGTDVHIFTDPGAPMRYVLIASELHRLKPIVRQCRRYPHLLLSMLMHHGVLQYIDKYEEQYATIACSTAQYLRNPTLYTHLEVHPALIMGICASLTPFSDKNQAPRNIYGAGMTKQSGAVNTVLPGYRNDTISLQLWYPQRPLAATSVADASHANDLPTGQNCIVAVLPFNGNNQEDAITESQSSLDFGMFRCYYERTHRDESNGQHISFQYIGPEQAMYDEHGNPVSNSKDIVYGAMGSDGVADVGAFVQKGDCIFGKREHNISDGSTKDQSSMYRGRERAQVVSVRYVCPDAGGNRRQVFLKTAAHRRPRIGDKFSSRHGQKGVCGDIVARQNLPYTLSGITPDLIINPHGQPSRMTGGQMIEGVVSKLQSILPRSRRSTQANATAFHNEMIGRDGYAHMDALDEAFRQLGYQDQGHEVVYSGITGAVLGPARIYCLSDGTCTGDRGTCIAPLYYQSLRHVSKDKLGARQRGPYDPITMQPIDGRSRNGGLRFGEMEKDALSCYGAAETLRGRLFKDSDAFPVVYCAKCHREGIISLSGQMYCKACDSYDSCIRTYLPRGMHCAMQESQAMLIGWRLQSAPVSANQFRNSLAGDTYATPENQQQQHYF